MGSRAGSEQAPLTEWGNVTGKQAAGDNRHGTAAPRTLTARSRVLGEIFGCLVNELGAFHGVIYLARQERSRLFSAAVGGPPPGVFAVPEWIPFDDDSASAEAYRTARIVSRPDARSSEYSGQVSPPLMPFPHYVVSVPLAVVGDTFGVLTGQWPPAELSVRLRVHARMEELGQRLGPELAECLLPGPGAPPVDTPLIVPVLTSSPAPGDSDAVSGGFWGLSDIPGSSALSMMYQVHKLSAALNKAFGLSDVIEATHDRVMAPFGARAFVVAISQAGRLRVVGHSGATGLAHAVHGSTPDADLPGFDVLRAGTPLFTCDPEATARYSEAITGGVRAVAVLPFNASGGLQGFLLLGFQTPRRISAEEQAVLLMMTTQLATAIERAHLSEGKRALTDVLQRKLLPRTLPELPELAVTARYLPAESAGSGLGGDWYDVIPLPRGQVGLIVGDVEGHNADSAAIMGQLRSGCRAYATEGHRPADVLARTSDLLAELDTDHYATCCFVRVDPESDIVEIALAGHPAPLLRCPVEGILIPEVPPNVPLGVVPRHTYSSAEIMIRPGTLLMLYTDGLASQGDPVSEARKLLDSSSVAENSSLHALADLLVSKVSRGRRSHDDFVVLLAQYEGSSFGDIGRVARTAIKRRDIRSVRSARKFVREFLVARGQAAIIDDAEVVVSEVVTNSLIHADSDVELLLRGYPDRIHIEVQDTDARPPVPTSLIDDEEENAAAEHGRGLDIVGDLSSDWGTFPHGRGKTVWMDLANDAEGAADQDGPTSR